MHVSTSPQMHEMTAFFFNSTLLSSVSDFFLNSGRNFRTLWPLTPNMAPYLDKTFFSINALILNGCGLNTKLCRDTPRFQVTLAF